MSWYRRVYVPGGTYFFTAVTEDRASILCTDLARPILHDAILQCASRRPFELVSVILLPDHLHAIWTLPPDDADYSTRWAAIKATFTRNWLAAGGRERARSASRVHNRRRGVWQRKFWEHRIRDAQDLERHMNYLHYNAVKHGLARCPHEWPWSTLGKWVGQGAYPKDWLCCCDGRQVHPLEFELLDEGAIECGE
jgi:putative transposase